MGESLSLIHAQGWTNLFLQGSKRRRTGRVETRQFYINANIPPVIISSVIRRKHITLTPDSIATILVIPNYGCCHYVKRNWPPLEGLSNALEIV